MNDNPELSAAAKRGKGMAASSMLKDTYSDEDREFLMAMDRYKRDYHRPNPTCCEVLAVLKSLGYAKAPKAPKSECVKCDDGWICEKHPERAWPHDDCAGPGMPCDAKDCEMSMLRQNGDFKASGY